MKLNKTNAILRGWSRRAPLLGAACCLLLSLPLGTASAHAGYQPDLLVKLASEGDAAYLGAGLFETTALAQSKTGAAFPGTPASYRVLLRNAGDQPDSFQLRGSGALTGVALRVLDPSGVDRAAALTSGFATATLAPGESLSFLVQVTPLAFLLGASFRVGMEAASVSDPGKTDQVKTETVACGSSAALILSTPPDGSGPPGSVVNYPYTATNVGNTGNSFTLAVAGPTGWSSALYADDGAGGGIAGDGVRQPGENSASASTGPLAPGASYRFFLAVQIPAGSADGARADVLVSATGQGASGSDQVATSATSAAISLGESVRNLTQGGAFASGANALPGDILEYRMSVTNSGSAPASAVGLTSAVPASSSTVPGSLWVSSSPAGEGSPCAAPACGSVRETAGSIVAHLGRGASDAAGGSLAPGSTLYVFFRVQVE